MTTEELEVIISKDEKHLLDSKQSAASIFRVGEDRAARLSETLANTYQTARSHDTEDQNPNCQHRVQLKIQCVKNTDEQV
jgi:hypothetical protein